MYIYIYIYTHIVLYCIHWDYTVLYCTILYYMTAPNTTTT